MQPAKGQDPPRAGCSLATPELLPGRVILSGSPSEPLVPELQIGANTPMSSRVNVRVRDSDAKCWASITGSSEQRRNRVCSGWEIGCWQGRRRHQHGIIWYRPAVSGLFRRQHPGEPAPEAVILRPVPLKKLCVLACCEGPSTKKTIEVVVLLENLLNLGALLLFSPSSPEV